MRWVLLIIIVSLVFIVLMYTQAIIKGMPVKRWTLLGGLLGPAAWCLFNLHYRRAWMRLLGNNTCGWRP